MDWLSEKTDLLKRDRAYFRFHPDTPCEIHTIVIQEEDNGDVRFENKVITSAQQYLEWTGTCCPSSTGTYKRTLVLAMHRRLDGSDCQFINSTKHLPYDDETFRNASNNLFQHRSIALTIARKSTTVINIRPVTWTSGASGQSIVYNCASNTESVAGEDDIILSATCFKDKPLRFAVMYGCTIEQIEKTTIGLRQQKQSAFHPLILPMVFLQLERQRIVNSFERKSSSLLQKVLDLKNRVISGDRDTTTKDGARNPTMTERDCEAIQLWLDMSSLKNGFESLLEQLASIKGHLEDLSDTQSKPSDDGQEIKDREEYDGIYIGLRLNEMMVELKGKIRRCETLLGGMTMATQMEWNYLSRRDARLNFSIAIEKHDDFIQWVMDEHCARGREVTPDELVRNIFITMVTSMHGTSTIAYSVL
ncbi:hypothetical protein VM1G_10189 [Cytospora mali]|uniref:Uncharacterized protein n=1 Tax=Cytospora mali TaxID=578113 RepID=A0A194WE58_CYTMA|nr:hypothetical protein VM1G_10189 [Valsa mali]